MLDRILCGNHLDLLPSLPSESVDFVCFSPPYDAIRDYTNGNTIDRIKLGKELNRVCKMGAACVVVIQDGTNEGQKSLTTARWQVEWADQCGWKLFECCIYARDGKPGAWWTKRFRVDHEYILIFFKGNELRCFDKEHMKVRAKHAGAKWHGTQRMTDGTLVKIEEKVQADTKCRGTIWKYNTSNTEGDALKMQHPATYPEMMAYDLIRCFSKEGDVVLDPCVGSGTTAVQAKILKRHYIGMDLSPEYCKIAEERLNRESDLF